MEEGTASVIRIVVVHTSVLLRRGLKAVLEENGCRIVGEAAHAAALAAQAPRGVQLMVHHLPRPMSGLHEALEQAARLGAHLLVLGQPTDELAVQALRMGARAVLSYSVDPAELLAAVRTTTGGGYHDNRWLRERMRGRGAAQPPALGKRMLQVLRLLAHKDCPSQKEIAGRMQVEQSTVATHCKRLFKRFRVRKRAELLRVAQEQGYLD